MGLFAKFRRQEEIMDDRPFIITSCVNGEVTSIKDVEDEVFSSECMGKGVGIEPYDGNIVAPINGEIVMTYPTKHALGIKTAEGIEILIHIGINTVEMKGKPFEIKVKQGDKVKRGQFLLEADFDMIKEDGKKSTVMMIITNTNKYKDIVECIGRKTTTDEAIRIVKE